MSFRNVASHWESVVKKGKFNSAKSASTSKDCRPVGVQCVPGCALIWLFFALYLPLLKPRVCTSFLRESLTLPDTVSEASEKDFLGLKESYRRQSPLSALKPRFGTDDDRLLAKPRPKLEELVKIREAVGGFIDSPKVEDSRYATRAKPS